MSIVEPRAEQYRNLGLKLTPQRLAILHYLEGNTTHPSAEDIYRAVKRRFPTMSFATVYNTLEMLRRRGRLIELTGDPVKKRFDPNTAPHHHFLCTGCGSMRDIVANVRVETDSAAFASLTVTGSHVEFKGLCPACRKDT